MSFCANIFKTPIALRTSGRSNSRGNASASNTSPFLKKYSQKSRGIVNSSNAFRNFGSSMMWISKSSVRHNSPDGSSS